MRMLNGLRKILIASTCAYAFIHVSDVTAQTYSNFDNNVVVDLSVLDDFSSPSTGPLSVESYSPYNGPKLPPLTRPKSQFFGSPTSSGSVLSYAPEEPKVPSSAVGGSKLFVKNLPAELQQKVKPVTPAPVETAAREEEPELTAPKAVPVKPVETKVVAAVEPTPEPTKPVKPETVVEKEVVVATPVPPVVKVPEVKVETPEVEDVIPKPEPALDNVKEKTEPTSLIVAPEVPEPALPTAPAILADAPPPPPPSAIEPKEVERKIETQTPVKNTTVTASLPSQAAESVRVSFEDGKSTITSAVQEDLKIIATKLRDNPEERVQLLAYAGGDDVSASRARRLSLSRALAVRSYLISQGVRSTRIDVRALGNKTTEEPFDRVDVNITPR